jgi:hypothetical protein
MYWSVHSLIVGASLTTGLAASMSATLGAARFRSQIHISQGWLSNVRNNQDVIFADYSMRKPRAEQYCPRPLLSFSSPFVFLAVQRIPLVLILALSIRGPLLKIAGINIATAEDNDDVCFATDIDFSRQ